jgi:hypothetical protein
MKGSILLPPKLVDKRFQTLTVNEEKTIHFHAVIPLYKNELYFSYTRGPEALIKRLGKEGVTELLKSKRTSAIKRKGIIFWDYEMLTK